MGGAGQSYFSQPATGYDAFSGGGARKALESIPPYGYTPTLPAAGGWGDTKGPTGGFGAPAIEGQVATQGNTGGATDWLPTGTYKKWREGDPEYNATDDAWAAGIGDWYRNPSWGGGIAWSPDYGWQSQQTIKDWGRTKGNSDPSTWGLTNNPGTDWSAYSSLPGVTPPDVGGGGGGEGGGGTTGGGDSGGGTTVPGTTNDMLERFGYTGPIGFNDYENAALNFITQMGQGGGPLATITPGQSFYGDVLGGKYGPTGDVFRKGVYDPTKAEAESLLATSQKQMADKFSHRGGYFGGTHAIAQSDLADKSNRGLASLLGNLNLEGFNQDLAAKQGAAAALPGMAQTQQNIVGDILQNYMSGGNLVTGREMTNRAELQGAQERAYNDWQRARQESLLPISLMQSLLGLQTTMPVVTQPGQSGWGALLAGLGSGLGGLTGLIH